MADEILDGVLGEETPQEPAVEPTTPPTEPSTEPTGEKKEEPKVPLSRLREEVDKRREAEQKAKIPETDLERKIRETLEKVETDKKVQAEQEDADLQKELVSLKEVYGDFDKERLLKIVDEYGVFNDNGDIKWDKAMDLYKNPNILSSTPARKMPTGSRTTEIPQKEPFNPKGQSMWKILEDAKKGLPIQ